MAYSRASSKDGRDGCLDGAGVGPLLRLTVEGQKVRLIDQTDNENM